MTTRSRRSRASQEEDAIQTAETPVETPAAEIAEWKTRSMVDADLRLPKTLRAKVGIGSHETYTITIVAQDESSFTLLFRKVV